MIIKFKRLTETAKLPSYAHPGDAGMDIYSDEEYLLRPGENHAFKTGLASEIDEEHVILFWDKGSMGIKSIKVFGGVVDSGYRGEWLVSLKNLSGNEIKIESGDKITQALIQKVECPEIIEVDSLNDSSRGEGRHGSTGRK